MNCQKSIDISMDVQKNEKYSLEYLFYFRRPLRMTRNNTQEKKIYQQKIRGDRGLDSYECNDESKSVRQLIPIFDGETRAIATILSSWPMHPLRVSRLMEHLWRSSKPALYRILEIFRLDTLDRCFQNRDETLR